MIHGKSLTAMRRVGEQSDETARNSPGTYNRARGRGNMPIEIPVLRWGTRPMMPQKS